MIIVVKPQEKSKVFAISKQYKALVEKKVGIPIKVLHTDHGGEYISHEFAYFYEIHGLKRQLTAAYTPHKMVFVKERIALSIMQI